jgi:peroxiredoxin
MTTLKETLATFRADSARRWGAERTALYEAKIEELRRSGILGATLGVGDRAPDFSLAETQGKPFRLREALDLGPVILTFYRGGWCPYCCLQLRAYQDALRAIEQLGGRLIGISQASESSWRHRTERAAFPILSDLGCR